MRWHLRILALAVPMLLLVFGWGWNRQFGAVAADEPPPPPAWTTAVTPSSSISRRPSSGRGPPMIARSSAKLRSGETAASAPAASRACSIASSSGARSRFSVKSGLVAPTVRC